MSRTLSVYGADKIWDHLNNVEGAVVARCTAERLMREMGIQGRRRGRAWVRTIEGDDTLGRPADLVERDFRAPAPNRLWVADTERHEALPNRATPGPPSRERRRTSHPLGRVTGLPRRGERSRAYRPVGGQEHDGHPLVSRCR
jgi:transposase InsO family protein